MSSMLASMRLKSTMPLPSSASVEAPRLGASLMWNSQYRFPMRFMYSRGSRPPIAMLPVSSCSRTRAGSVRSTRTSYGTTPPIGGKS